MTLTSHVPSHCSFNSLKSVGGGRGCRPHFTDERSEAQRSSATCPRSHSGREARAGTGGPTCTGDPRERERSQTLLWQKARLPRTPFLTCPADPGAPGSNLIGAIGTCHSLFYGLCALTCVRVGGDVPSCRLCLPSVWQGPLFINLSPGTQRGAAAGQAPHWAWGAWARPTGRSRREVPGVVGVGREASSGGAPVSSLAGTQVQRSCDVPKSQSGHGNSEFTHGLPPAPTPVTGSPLAKVRIGGLAVLPRRGRACTGGCVGPGPQGRWPWSQSQRPRRPSLRCSSWGLGPML